MRSKGATATARLLAGQSVGKLKKRRKRGKKVMKERECKEYAWVNIGFIRDLVSHFHSVFNKWDRGSVAATSESEDTSDAVLVDKTGDY